MRSDAKKKTTGVPPIAGLLSAINTNHAALAACVKKNKCEKPDYVALVKQQGAVGRGFREVYSSGMDQVRQDARVVELTAQAKRITDKILAYEGALDIYRCTLDKCKAQHAADQQGLIKMMKATGNTKMVRAIEDVARLGPSVTASQLSAFKARLIGV